MEQRRRLRILNDFKEGKLPVLVASDVASRGLHIEAVSHVVNWDLPQDPEDYVHRIGRTARAGAEGKAISLVDEASALNLEAIEKFLGHKISVEWPEDDRFMEEIKPTARSVAGIPRSAARDSETGARRDGRERGGSRPGERPPHRARPPRPETSSERRMETPPSSERRMETPPPAVESREVRGSPEERPAVPLPRARNHACASRPSRWVIPWDRWPRCPGRPPPRRRGADPDSPRRRGRRRGRRGPSPGAPPWSPPPGAIPPRRPRG